MSTQSDDQGTVRYIRCPSCGTPNPATAEACYRCSKPMEPSPASPAAQPPRGAAPPAGAQQKVNCQNCGKPLPVGSKFCGFCGAALPAPAPKPVAPERPLHAPPPRIAPSIPQVKVPPVAPTPSSRAPQTAPTPATRPPAPKPAPPAPSISEGTVVFAGLKAAKLEASITEVKADGLLGKAVSITKEFTIGRENCTVSYPEDALLSPRHAALLIREGKLILKDLESQNGTFIKQRQDTELRAGDVLLLGQALFRFKTQSMDEAQDQGSLKGTWMMAGAPKLPRGPLTAKLEHIQLSGEVIEEFSLEKPEITIGRSQGDLVFKNDPYMSGRHARILTQPGRFILQDLQSTNGVYRRIQGEVELKDTDEFFLGEQRFRVAVKQV